MNSRTLLNIGLLVLLVGLGLITFFEPGLEPAPVAATLSTIDPADITQIHISRLQKPQLQFHREQDSWRIVSDESVPASEFQVRSLIELAGTEAKRSYSLDQLDLSKLELNEPFASVSFNAGLTIEFGNTEPLGGQRYVKVGDKVHLIEDRFQHLVEADFTTFVDHRLLAEGSRITDLQLPKFRLTRSKDLHWSLAPDDMDISADAIQELVDAWQHASALWVRKYAGEPALSPMQLMLEGAQEPIVLQIVSRDPELVLARPEWHIQYHFTADIAEKMFTFREPQQNGELPVEKGNP